MVYRKHRQDYRVRSNFHVKACGIFSQVVLRQHDSLALSCGSGRKHDSAKRILCHCRLVASPVVIYKPIKRKHLWTMLCTVHRHIHIYIMTAFSCGLSHIRTCLIKYKHPHIGSVQKLTYIRCRKRCIDWNRNTSAFCDCQIGYYPLI